MSLLRAMVAADLPFLTGGESPYDDFGPAALRPAPASARLDDQTGSLTVEVDGEVAGSVGWYWQAWGPNAASRCVMIGVWLRPSHRGRGIGTRAQAELVDLVFRHTAVNRVEAHTDVENLAEQRSLEKAGLLREGVTRGAQWRDGRYHDGVLYAVLRGDRA